MQYLARPRDVRSFPVSLHRSTLAQCASLASALALVGPFAVARRALRAAGAGLFLLALAPYTATFGANYTESFNNGAAQGWTAVSGTWAVDDGATYHSSANSDPDITVYSSASWATDFAYHVRAKMNNADTGNRVGLLY